MTDESVCPFCKLDHSQVVRSNELAIAFYDGFPVTPGHSLIAPRRHIVSFFEATQDEQAALFSLLGELRELLLNPTRLPFDKAGSSSVPAGFNVGINDGAAAGQTVMHLHIHLIPRYANDTDDPRGGVRWIMPEKAPYWKRG